MAKLIEFQDAAEMLGISPEELTDMRSRNEIFGYRDGSTWKFKLDEIERVKSLLAERPSDELSGGSDDDLDELVDAEGLDLEADDLLLEDAGDDADVFDLPGSGDDSDSILVSEEELGQSDENTASTIIGEPDDLLPQDSAAAGSDALADESDLELSLDKSDVVSASDIFDDAEEKPASGSDTANLRLTGSSDVGDDLKLQDSGSLELSLEDSSIAETGVSGEGSDESVKASSSGFGSAIDLGLEDDELVLGSGAGSDVTLGAGDSGINLGNPSDSGLSLEEPLELGGGSGVESLELGEEEMLDLDESLGATGDDDFMLTPVEDGLEEESDSGSQVIALDGEEFGDSAVALLTDEEDLEGETAEFIPDDETAPAEVGLAAASPTSVGVAADADESTYTVWNVLSLFSILLVLGFTGILMLDLINNMWSWRGAYPVNSTIMDAILNMMPGT